MQMGGEADYQSKIQSAMRSRYPLFCGIFGDEIDVAVCDLDDGVALDFKRRERLELELRTAHQVSLQAVPYYSGLR
jgi:hypothetical protein